MPSRKKKYNARFPPARIKKIMQTDEEVGKVAQAVPIIIYILFHEIINFFKFVGFNVWFMACHKKTNIV
ncbi:hypothetical protein HHI36_020705 [Cryptolaemus montrouzieri]|uniref:Transcription factor CBF/NF-Y/archaeal histone domain-containing protein n=1 Tax=Cryptolaemus montrouzieri TaxID=559131 RepID=A0ABD2NC63_9CUCU